jgi:UDP-GlcNAc:undecaprenyl-phosphate/decaprenyl-phosphate GlcNAc-1-phosphate transferase
MQTIYFIGAAISLLLTFALIPALRSLALRIKLVDLPNHRKVHESPVPVTGGISIFLSTTTVLWVLLPSLVAPSVYSYLFLASFLLLIMGVLDDRFDLNALLKLSIQLLLAHGVYQQGIRMETLHGFIGMHEIPQSFQYLLTILAISGFMNAFNLMDGIDGLAAGIALSGFALLATLAAINNQPAILLISTTLLGSLGAFIRFNLSKNKKIFMGDAGSLILGFLLAVLGIQLLQTANGNQYDGLTAFSVIAITLLPVLDALRVFLQRAMDGKSLVHGDKTHLHHLVLGLGLKHRYATLLILFTNAAMILIGFFTFKSAGITTASLAMVLVFLAFTGMLRFNQQLMRWKNEIRYMEQGFQTK